MLAPGTHLQSRFQIIRPLGKGGMGHVYEAFDDALECSVAIKETFAKTPELRQAFKREAKLLANLRHPALPRVIHHFFEGDGQFLVMDYIGGDNLDRIIEKRSQPFPFLEVARLADKIFDALEYLHGFSKPIIHRDVKPANIKLAERKQVFLLDFGLAKGTANHFMMRDSGAFSVYGFTAAYAPLEQVNKTGTNEQSDLYSFGATLYHLLTGVAPPPAAERFVKLERDKPDPLLPAHVVNPNIPEPISVVLTRSMSMSRRKRFESAGEMRRTFEEAVSKVDTSTLPAYAELEYIHISETATLSDLPTERSTGSGVESPKDKKTSKDSSSNFSFPFAGETRISEIMPETVVVETETGAGKALSKPAEKSDPSIRPAFGRRVTVAAAAAGVLGLSILGYNLIPTTVSDQASSNSALTRLTTEAAIHVKAGDALLAQDKRTEADAEYAKSENLYQSVVSSQPENANLHASLAAIFMLRNKLPEAIAEYREAVRLAPDNHEYKAILKKLESFDK